MSSHSPLSELVNQRQPRRKATQTYGKKKGANLISQQTHQDIFAREDDELVEKFEELLRPSKTCLESKRSGGRHKSLEVETVSIDTRKSSETRSSEHGDRHALERLLDLSGSGSIEQFTTFGNKLSRLFDIEKIGEGSFAEVFKITSIDPESVSPGSTTSSTTRSRSRTRLHSPRSPPMVDRYTSIIKVIPLLQSTTSSHALDRCSSIDTVTHEINILKQLDPIHGFTRYRGLRLVKGSWPASFLEAYQGFKTRHRKRAINASPEWDFDSTQLYAIVEMDDAGSEISLIKKPSVFQVWDIFWIAVILLANAEECIEFEHRDLHMSNICVKAAPTAVTTLESSAISGDIDNKSDKHKKLPTRKEQIEQPCTPDVDLGYLETLGTIPDTKIGLSNLRVTLIDYTVARACLPVQTLSSTSKSDVQSSPRIGSRKGDDEAEGVVMFEPLSFTSDPFNSSREDIEAYLQNLTYRKTRATAILSQKLQQTHNVSALGISQKILRQREEQGMITTSKWRASIPRTNTIWLGYLLRILIRRSRTKTTGKLHMLKGKKQLKRSGARMDSMKGKKTTKAGSKRSKKCDDDDDDGEKDITTTLQESMWNTLLQTSRLINGDDYREIEDDNLPKFDDDDDSNRNEFPTETEEKSDTDGDDRHDDNNNDNEKDNNNAPQWTREELESLPSSALDVLELAVSNGWIGAEEIQSFRRTLEDENS